MTDALNKLFIKAYVRLHDERGMEALTLIAIAIVMIPAVIFTFKYFGDSIKAKAVDIVDQIKG
jgi:hypothetical protein